MNKSNLKTLPSIGAAPSQTRMIELGTLALEASASGAAERYGRGKTSHSGQVWWARRPHAAMRAVVFASIVRNEGKESANLLSRLAIDAEPLEQLLRDAQEMIGGQYPSPPVVLDAFGGGGTIPQEAASLGARVHSRDYNALSVFIQQTNLHFSQSAFKNLGKNKAIFLLRETGAAVLQEAKAKTEVLYPARSKTADCGGTPFAYFWTYKMACPKCTVPFHLSKRFWLSKKTGRHQRISVIRSHLGEKLCLVHGDTHEKADSIWTGRSGSVCCPFCSHVEKNPSVKACEDVLAAFGVYRAKGGKAYAAEAPESVALVPTEAAIDQYVLKILSDLKGALPTSVLPRWSGIVNPSLYGIETHADLLNRRQTASCLTLISVLDDKFSELSATHGKDVAFFVVGVLSAFIDQIVDWNSRLSMWIPQNEQVGRALCGPGISMIWDYAETDPFVDGPANLWDKLKRVIAAVESVPVFRYVPEIAVGCAQDLDLADNSVDAIVSDPPYYDNIFYNILSDCIFSWKRILFSEKYPILFAPFKTGEDSELVASKIRQGSSSRAHEWYCAELTKALSEFARVLKPNGIISFVYGHSSLLGWEAIVRGFKASGLFIETVEPLSIERRQRPRAMTSDAVNTCIVIVARKRIHGLAPTSMNEFKERFDTVTAGLSDNLTRAGWLEADVGMALFANAVGILATCSNVTGRTNLEVLREIATDIQRGLPEFEMQTRGAI